MNIPKLIADLRRIVASDVLLAPTDLEPEQREAIEWAQRRILDAADALAANNRPPPKPAPRREFSAAERQAYGEIMRAKREREAAHGSRGRGPKKTHRQHLYSGHA